MERGKSEADLRAHAILWNHLFRFISSMSLKCALELDIAEIIHRHGHPMSLADLASALCLPLEKVPALHRLMRLMTYSGIFNVIPDDVGGAKYKLNTTSMLLLNHDGGLNSGITSVKPHALLILDPVCVDPWHALAAWFRDAGDSQSPFELTHNASFWELAGADPKFNRFFSDAMASDTHLLMTAVTSRPECRQVFSNVRTLVDVGGATGVASKALANAFPALKCTVLELPHVVDEAVETNEVKFVKGDMFRYIPPADAILLKSILHDWRDEDCVKILKHCREAILENSYGGKVIVLDMILNNSNQDQLHVETQFFFDMLMMTLTPGKERSEIEWSELFKLAGFSGYKIISTLGSRSLMEVYP